MSFIVFVLHAQIELLGNAFISISHICFSNFALIRWISFISYLSGFQNLIKFNAEDILDNRVSEILIENNSSVR